MSTDIKPGERIRAVRDTHSWGGDRFPKGTELVFFGLMVDGDGFDWEAGPPESAPEGNYLVCPADFEIAPLDPSKVKAGDTVTLRVDADPGYMKPFTVAGETYSLPGHGAEVFVGGWGLSRPGVTLTDHQPAPEPEPEWKPGASGTATLNHLAGDLSALDMRVMRVEWDGLLGFATQTGRLVEDGSTKWSVSDFVPDAPVPRVTREQIAEAIMTADTATTGNYGLYPDVATVAADAVLALLAGGAS